MIIIQFLGTMMYYTSLLTFMLLYTPICFIVWIFTTPFDKKRLVNHKMNNLVGYMIIFLNPFWRTNIYGMEKADRKATYVVAPNHQSLTDICLIASTRLDLKWISKKELTYTPLLGWVMGMAKYILLSRKDPKSQMKMMKTSEYFLNNDVSIAIFPEGTRSPDGEIGKFRDGASLLARKTNRQILPICMYGNNNAMPEKGFIWKKVNNISMYVLDPIDPAEYKTKELSNVVKAAISAKLEELKAADLAKEKK